MALPRYAEDTNILYEPPEDYQSPLVMPSDIGSRSPLEKAAYYNQLIDQGYDDSAIRQAAGQQTDADWSALQGLASGLRAPAPTVSQPTSALPQTNVATQVAGTPVTTAAVLPSQSQSEVIKTTPAEVVKTPASEVLPETKPIVDVAPEYVAPGLYRTPGGNYINDQGYPVDAATAQRIISGGAAPVSSAATTAPATNASALQQAASASPQSLFTSLLGADPSLADQLRANYNQAFNQGEASTFYDAGIQVGDYTLRSMPIGYDFSGNRTGGGFQATKTATNDRGLPLETVYSYDDNGGITGAEVRYFTGSDSGVVINLDAQGNKIGEKGFDYSEQWKGAVAPLVSMAAMAFAGPVAQSLGAVLGGGTATLASEIAANAIVRGGLGAAQAGLMGGDPLKGALTGAATGALGAGGTSLANTAAAETLAATGSQVAADAVRGAVQSGLNAIPGAIVSGDLSGLGQAALTGAVTSGVGSAAGQVLSGTGITQQQVASGLALAQQLQSGKPNISAIANAAAGLVNSPDVTVAAKAIALVDTISKAGSNPAALMGVMEAANQLSSAVERASVPKGLSDAATAAFINAKRTGATDDEAAAAAQAVSGGTVGGIKRLPGTAPTVTTQVTGENLGTVGPANLDIGNVTSIELPRPPTQEELNASIANGINNAATFEDAYASARAAFGAGKTFTWQGKSYSTDTRQENPDLAAASDTARQAATGAGAGRGTLGGMTAAEAANLLNVPLRTTPTGGTTGNQVFDTAQYDALGNLIGGTAYNTEGVDTTTGLGRVGNVAANVINTAAGMVGTYGPSAVQAGANLISNVGGIIDLAAGRSTDAGNFLRNNAEKITKFVDTISDPEVKAGQQRIGDAIDAADGFVNKVFALGKSIAKDPVSAFNWMLTEGFEEVPGVGLAVKVGNKLGRHGKLSGYGIMGVSILNDAVESGGSAYNDTYQSALREGLTESEARTAARNSALASMLATGVTQGVVEGKLLSKAIGKETIGEGVEGAAQSAAAQYAVTGTVDANKVIKDALIEASVGKGASTSATGLTGTGGTTATTAPTTAASTAATTGATTGATTSTGGISTLTGAPTSGVSVTGADISTAGTGSLDAASIINDYVSTVLQGGGTSQDVNASIGSAVNSAVSSGADAASSVVAATNAAANAGGNTAAATNAAVDAANAAGANVSVSGGIVTSNQTTGGVTTQSSVDTNTGVSQSTSTNTNTGTTTNTQTDTNTGNSTATQTNANTNTTTQTDTNTNNNTSTTTAVNNNTSTTTQVDGNTNTSTTTKVDANTNTTTQTNANTGVTTTTKVDTNTGTETKTTVDGNTTTTTKTDPNTNTTTTTTTDTNTNTSTTVTTNTDTGVVVSTTSNPVTPVKPVAPVPPVTPPVPPKPPVTPPQPPVTPPVAPPVTPPVAPPVVNPRTTLPAMAAALPAFYGGGQDMGRLAPQMLESKVTQGYVDPLAQVRQAQEQFEREAMMQNIDPRLMQILSERMGAPQGGLAANDQSHYSYGQEDSIDDILGGQAANYAKGGYVEPLQVKEGGMPLPLMAKAGGLPTHRDGRENFKDGKHVAGEGDGQSDDIPAWLADGEFVFPADVVSALGNGSTKAGTDKLYEMMHAIRERARSKGPKDLPPPALKSPLDYLKSKR